jgi:hypothetical protein
MAESKRALISLLGSLFIGLLCVAFVCTASAKDNKGQNTTDKSGSKDDSSTTKDSAKPTDSAPDTSDLGSWMAYAALRKASCELAAKLPKDKDKGCQAVTFASIQDAVTAYALIDQLVVNGRKVTAYLCQIEKSRKISAPSACPSFHPAESGVTISPDELSAVTAAISGLVQLIQTFVPTYTIKSAAVTITASSVSQSIQGALLDNNFDVMTPSIAQRKGGSQIAELVNVINAAVSQINESTKGGANSQCVADCKAALDAATAFVTPFNDPTKSTLKDAILAETMQSLPPGTCFLEASANGGAGAIINRETFFTKNIYFEAGSVVLSFAATRSDGRVVSAGTIPATCELDTMYEMGSGTPPSPDNVKCDVFHLKSNGASSVNPAAGYCR